MSEPTSVLTFSDLILEVAYKLGIAYYGAAGDEAAQVPIDPHDLDLCKRTVNNAIRMFIHDAPAGGWRWLRPVAQLDLWPTISDDTSNKIATAVYSAGTGLTTLTIPTAKFYPSMELRTISFNSGASSATIAGYISGTSVTVTGDFHTVANQTWSITTTGDYTLPQTFGGQFTGHPTFVSGTNRGMTLNWTDESQIRERRANMNQETGTPYMMAVRIMNTTATPRRRWEMMFYRMPGEFLSVLFPYTIHFDELTQLTDVSPAPFGHDETLKAACKAQAEKDVEDTINGPEWQYYRSALANSWRVDALSAPKNLGYFGNPTAARLAQPPIRAFRDQWYQRPTVPFNQ